MSPACFSTKGLGAGRRIALFYLFALQTDDQMCLSRNEDLGLVWLACRGTPSFHENPKHFLGSRDKSVFGNIGFQ